MSAKHTPGPWKPVKLDKIYIYSEQLKESPIACITTGSWIGPGGGEANADLIAAAPALLYTLIHIRDALGILDGGPATEELALIAHSAIKQARGEREQAIKEGGQI